MKSGHIARTLLQIQAFLWKSHEKGNWLSLLWEGDFFISTVAWLVDLGGAWNHPQCCESGWARIVLLFPWGHWLKGAVLLKIIPTDNFSESDKRDWEVLPAGAGCSHWVEGKDWEQRLRSSSSLSAPGSRKLFRNGRFQFQLSGGNYFGNHEKCIFQPSHNEVKCVLTFEHQRIIFQGEKRPTFFTN